MIYGIILQRVSALNFRLCIALAALPLAFSTILFVIASRMYLNRFILNKVFADSVRIFKGMQAAFGKTFISGNALFTR